MDKKIEELSDLELAQAVMQIQAQSAMLQQQFMGVQAEIQKRSNKNPETKQINEKK